MRNSGRESDETIIDGITTASSMTNDADVGEFVALTLESYRRFEPAIGPLIDPDDTARLVCPVSVDVRGRRVLGIVILLEERAILAHEDGSFRKGTAWEILWYSDVATARVTESPGTPGPVLVLEQTDGTEWLIGFGLGEDALAVAASTMVLDGKPERSEQAECGACGAPVAANARFCGACGTQITAPAPRTGTLERVPSVPIVPPRPGEPPVADAVRTPRPVADRQPDTAASGSGGRRNRRNVVLFSILGAVVAVTVIGMLMASLGDRTAEGAQSDGRADTSNEGAESWSAAEPGQGAEVDPGTAIDQESVAATPTPSAATPIEFVSESNNIRCSIGEDGVLCIQQSIKYQSPRGNCPSTYAAAAVSLDDGGVAFPCVSDDIQSTNVLPYDTSLTRDGYECVINYVTGVTCVNLSGTGFRMEYESGIVVMP